MAVNVVPYVFAQYTHQLIAVVLALSVLWKNSKVHTTSMNEPVMTSEIGPEGVDRQYNIQSVLSQETKDIVETFESSSEDSEEEDEVMTSLQVKA